MGFEITQVAPVVAFIDTQELARDLFWKEDRSRNISLKDLCTFLGFRPINLHNCGNDAAYTLVVLLSLACKILQNDTLGNDTPRNGTPRNDTPGNDTHGNDTHGNDTHGILQEIIQAALLSAKTARRIRKDTGREEQGTEDWAENLDSEIF